MITTNTLENISKYSNKLIKLASYFSQNDDNLMFQQLSILNENSPMEDILEAFTKDLDNTAKCVFDVQKLINSIDSNHIIEELKNEEKDVSILFGDKYEKTGQSLKIAGIQITKYSNYSKSDIKNKICENILDISFNDFKKLAKVRMEDKKWDIYELETTEDKIDYLSRIDTIEKLQSISKTITSSIEDFNVARRNINMGDRDLIDRKITGSRAMVDSIIQNSTYIVDGEIKQIGTKHKKQKDKVQKIAGLIKGSKMSGVELDTDSDLDKVIDVIEKINDLNLNIHNPFVFKVRKLGNYNANGLYFPSSNIVAVDLAKPSAAIHEITHLIDINNSDIFQSESRQNMIFNARGHLDLQDIEDTFSPRLAKYFNNPQEIIARLGEISYILSKYDYQEGDVKKFMDKVELLQVSEKNTTTDISISKPISEYRSLSSVYFRFDSWDEDFAKEVKKYYESYFVDNNIELTPIKEIKIEKPKNIQTIQVKSKTTHNTAENLFTGFNPENVERIINKNSELNLIREDVLVNSLFMNAACISRLSMRSKGGAAHEEYRNAKGTIENLGKMVENPECNDILRKSVFFNSMLFHKPLGNMRDHDYSTLSGIPNSEFNDDTKYVLDTQGFKIGPLSLNKQGVQAYNKILSGTEVSSRSQSGSNYTDMLEKLNNDYDYEFIKVSSERDKDLKYEFTYSDENIKFESISPLYIKLLREIRDRVLTKEESLLFIKAFDKLTVDEELKQDFSKGYFQNLRDPLELIDKDLHLDEARKLINNTKKVNKVNKKYTAKDNLSLF